MIKNVIVSISCPDIQNELQFIEQLKLFYDVKIVLDNHQYHLVATHGFSMIVLSVVPFKGTNKLSQDVISALRFVKQSWFSITFVEATTGSCKFQVAHFNDVFPIEQETMLT